MSEQSTFSAALGGAAPADERIDALTHLQKLHTPGVAELMKAHEMTPLIEAIQDRMAEEAMQKSLTKNNVIPFPSDRAKAHQQGMQSVWLDDMQVHINGDYYEKPGVFTFDGMRQMVEQTPILNAVIMTRIRQVQAFCHMSKHDEPGFSIRLKDDDVHPKKDETESIGLLEKFFLNCGWETNPRRRQRLHRDNFSGFMAKMVRDTLTMDSCPIETEYKKDKSLGVDGLYAVDGATIRLCSEVGYQGDDEIFALQVVNGRIRSLYTYEDLIYVPRNPRSDVIVGGYGLGETELLIRVVTGFLNAFSYNTKYFDANAIPKGMLHLSGDYSEQDIAAFKRYWNSMVKGVSNAWALPVMISKDQESKAAFEKFGADSEEMMFSKWMTFLASLICAIYSIAPDEINFESFSASKTSALSGNDTGEKLANSKDKGLNPLLSYYADLFTDYVVAEYGDKYAFFWNGLEDEDEKQSFEEVKLCNTVNELRASRGEDKITDPWGDAPLNPSLIAVWQQSQQQDYGQPGEAPPGAPPDDGYGQPQQTGDGDPPPDGGGEDNQPEGEAPPSQAGPGKPGGKGNPPPPEAMQKAFGLPIYSVADY
jgi:hypothetical protein